MASQNTQPAKTEVEIPGYLRISKLVVWFAYFFIIIGIVSLTLRVFLLLFNANISAGFSQFIANVSADYMGPFRGIFPTSNVTGESYLDVSALFAILVYLFVLWGIHSLINYVQNRIDISRAQQEKEIAEIKRQKELEAQRAAKAAKSKKDTVQVEIKARNKS